MRPKWWPARGLVTPQLCDKGRLACSELVKLENESSATATVDFAQYAAGKAVMLVVEVLAGHYRLFFSCYARWSRGQQPDSFGSMMSRVHGVFLHAGAAGFTRSLREVYGEVIHKAGEFDRPGALRNS